jgi:hypothetical protein
MLGGIVCCWLTEPTYGLQRAIPSPFGVISSKKTGLQYVVGLSIQTGNICWWSRLYAPGKWNNLSIFRHFLVSMLKPGERCKTDRGYQDATLAYVKCPGVVETNPNTAQIQQWVQSRQETVNKRFKIWAILPTLYHHICGRPFVSSSILINIIKI